MLKLAEHPPQNRHRLLNVPIAYVIPYDQDRPTNVLLREGAHGLFGLAGGKLRVQERPLLGALRELKEEVGLELAPAAFLHLGRYHSPEFFSMWSTQKALEHGYQLRHALHDPGRGLLPVVHARQDFFAVAIHPDEAPSRFNGRRYKFVNLMKERQLLRVKPRFLPVLDDFLEKLDQF